MHLDGIDHDLNIRGPRATARVKDAILLHVLLTGEHQLEEARLDARRDQVVGQAGRKDRNRWLVDVVLGLLWDVKCFLVFQFIIEEGDAKWHDRVEVSALDGHPCDFIGV